MYTDINAFIYTFIFIYIHKCIYVYIQRRDIYTHTRIDRHAEIFARTNIYVFMCSMYIYIYIYMATYIDICVTNKSLHIYIYM